MGNLGKRRDTRRVTTLSEYARRRDLYHATPRGLAIEAFLDAGLDAAEDSVTVSAGVVAAIERRLSELTTLLQQPTLAVDAIDSLWGQVHK